MFADVAGSTKLFERLGDLAARDLLAHALKLMEQAVLAHGGRVMYLGANGYYWVVGFRPDEPWCMAWVHRQCW